MNTYDIKTVADAAVELTRKTTQNVTDASAKAWKDFYTFGDTVAKAQLEVLKEFTGGNAYGDIYSSFTKTQTEAIKSVNNWVNMLHGNASTGK